MSDLSTALKEAYARADTHTLHLVGLELANAATGTLRYVNYDSDITISGIPHTAMGMEISEPEIGTEPSNKVQIRIDGAATSMQYYINGAVDAGINISATVRPLAYNVQTSTVIDVVGAFEFKVLQAKYDMSACLLVLGHTSPTNQTFPGKRYDPLTYPNLFR